MKQRMHNRIAENEGFGSDVEGPGIPGDVFGLYSSMNELSLRVIAQVRSGHETWVREDTMGMK